VANGIVYIGTSNSLLAVNASTGATVRTLPVTGGAGIVAAVVNGFVYAGNRAFTS
jgi:outer membrane protein assembly factor BamB